MSGGCLSISTAFLAALMAAGFASCAEGAFISGVYHGAGAENQSSAPPLRHRSEPAEQVWAFAGETGVAGCGWQPNQPVREFSGSGISWNLAHLLGGPGACVALPWTAVGKVMNPIPDGPLKPPKCAAV